MGRISIFRRHTLCSAVGAAFAIGSLACGQAPRRDAVEPALIQDVNTLVARSTPEGVTARNLVPLARHAGGVHSSWEIETDLTWPAYCGWLVTRIPPEYKRSGACDSTVTFSRTTPADAFALQVERVATVPRLRVRLDYHGYPF